MDEEAELAGGQQIMAQHHDSGGGARLSANSSPGKKFIESELPCIITCEIRKFDMLRLATR